MTLNSGHAVVEPNGYVQELSVPTTATNASVDVQQQGTVNTAVVDSSSATVTVSQGAEVNQYVGDTTNVSGAGATSVTQNAVTKTLVGTKEELVNAIADVNAKYIELSADIDAQTRLTLDRDVILDGSSAKHTLTFSSENISNGRAINIGWDAENINVSVKNLKVVGPTSGGYTRGLNVGQPGTKVIVDNCEVSCKYYALNVISSADGASIKVSDSKFSGWAALNLWSSIRVEVSNSTLEGTSISKGEGFATICFEADTTDKTSDRVSDAKVAVKNSVIRSIFDYTDGDGYQSMIGYNYTSTDRSEAADHNTFEAIDCDFQYQGSQDNLILAYDFCAYGAVTTNITIVNGRTLDFSSTYYVER